MTRTLKGGWIKTWHAHTQVHTCTRTHTQLHAQCTSTHACRHSHTHAQAHSSHTRTCARAQHTQKPCTCTCTHAHVHTRMHAHTSMHAYAHMYMCTCACTRTHVHTREYHSALKKKGTLPFVTTWLGLGDVALRERSRCRKTNTAGPHLRVDAEMSGLPEAESRVWSPGPRWCWPRAQSCSFTRLVNSEV